MNIYIDNNTTNKFSDLITENVNGYKYIHVSRNLNLDGNIFYPRVPDTRMIGDNLENGFIPRICFSEGSIDQALAAIIDWNAYKEMTDCKYAVYVPINDNIKKLSNNQINNKKYVYDSHITKEMWFLEPVKLKKLEKYM